MCGWVLHISVYKGVSLYESRGQSGCMPAVDGASGVCKPPTALWYRGKGEERAGERSDRSEHVVTLQHRPGRLVSWLELRTNI